ncbi:MAG TPA: hypothetical protein ENN22_04640 [bacterium]|nr:hypothetical protein [bacterium]
MIKLPEAVKKAILKQDVFPVATSNQDKTPNVAYIKYLKVMDDQTVLIADNYLDKTRKNILNNRVLSGRHQRAQQRGGASRPIRDASMLNVIQGVVLSGRLRRSAFVTCRNPAACAARLLYATLSGSLVRLR